MKIGYRSAAVAVTRSERRTSPGRGGRSETCVPAELIAQDTRAGRGGDRSAEEASVAPVKGSRQGGRFPIG